MMNKLKPNRRDFLKVTALAGGGLMIGINLISCNKTEEWPEFEQSIGTYVIINGDGSATIMSKNPELGQGVKTALPMILAEELDIPWDKVTVQQAVLDDRMAPQFAGGSTGVPLNYEVMRRAGATVRYLLVSAAAKLWEVNPKDCYTDNGHVLHGRKKVHYGQVAIEAAKMDLPEEVELKNPEEFKIIGNPQKDVDLKSIVTGIPLFGLDQEIEGMLYATVIKPEVFGSKVVSFDASKAKAIEGVVDVFKIEGFRNPTMLLDGIAIVAENIWTAFRVKKMIQVEWRYPKQYIRSMEDLNNRFDKSLSDKGSVLREDGDVDVEFGKRDLIEAVYRVPFISHSQMEPMNFIADVQEDYVRLIGPTQTPGSARGMASHITGIPPEKISVQFTRVGGGFGRRLFNDYANEAVYISHKLKRPIKLIWDRESDFLSDYYRPAGAYKLKAKLAGRQLTAFEAKISTTSRYAYRLDQNDPHVTEAFPDQQPAGMIPNFRISYVLTKSNVPVGALRTPGVNATTFAYQCFLDELAEKAKMDPIDFHLNLLGVDRDLPYRDHPGPSYNTGRLKEVINLVRQKSGWNDRRETEYHLGFAAQYVFGTYIAQVVDVRWEKQRLKINKVYAAVDCGRVINPIGADAQIQGGITDGISAALFEKIDLEDGKLIQRNFDQYRKLRMEESPEVEVYFVDSEETPTGLGEPSYPVIFPALCNAIYAATGKRIRELPIIKTLTNL